MSSVKVWKEQFQLDKNFLSISLKEALTKRLINESDYQKWVGEYYSIPLLNSSYFENRTVDSGFWSEVQNDGQWDDSLAPLFEWDQSLYVACLEPQPQKIKTKKNIVFLLASVKDMESLWSQLNDIKKAMHKTAPHDSNKHDDENTPMLTIEIEEEPPKTEKKEKTPSLNEIKNSSDLKMEAQDEPPALQMEEEKEAQDEEKPLQEKNFTHSKTKEDPSPLSLQLDSEPNLEPAENNSPESEEEEEEEDADPAPLPAFSQKKQTVLDDDDDEQNEEEIHRELGTEENDDIEIDAVSPPNIFKTALSYFCLFMLNLFLGKPPANKKTGAAAVNLKSADEVKNTKASRNKNYSLPNPQPSAEGLFQKKSQQEAPLPPPELNSSKSPKPLPPPRPRAAPPIDDKEAFVKSFTGSFSKPRPKNKNPLQNTKSEKILNPFSGEKIQNKKNKLPSIDFTEAKPSPELEPPLKKEDPAPSADKEVISKNKTESESRLPVLQSSHSPEPVLKDKNKKEESSLTKDSSKAPSLENAKTNQERELESRPPSSQISAKQAFSNLKKHFDSQILFICKNHKFIPCQWSQELKPKKKKPVPTNQPSLFRICYRTKQPYFGPLSPILANNTFFENWGFESLPQNVVLLPMLDSSQNTVLGGYLGIAKEKTFSLDFLNFIQKEAEGLEAHFKNGSILNIAS